MRGLPILLSATAAMSLAERGQVHRAWADFVELPGLAVTAAQARRLWALDEKSCETVLAVLVRAGFLERTDRGAYVRCDRAQIGAARLTSDPNPRATGRWAGSRGR